MKSLKPHIIFHNGVWWVSKMRGKERAYLSRWTEARIRVRILNSRLI